MPQYAESGYRHHDSSDKTLALLEPHVGTQRRVGGVAEDNRRFIHAIFWIVRPVRPSVICRQLWRMGNTHRLVIPWRDKGIGEKLLDVLIYEPDANG